MTISSIRIVSSDKVMPYVKGVGAEDSYVKGCIRHGEIIFAVLSYRKVRRAIGIRSFNGTFNDSLTRTVIFFVLYIKDRLENYNFIGRGIKKCKFATTLTQMKRVI